MKVTVTALSKGKLGYKTASYRVWDASVFMNSADNTKDWSGLYVAENESVAEGYLSDAGGANGTAYIHTVALLVDEMPMLECLDDSFKDGNIDMDALREAVRQVGLEIDDNQPFMPQLGEQGYAFRCYNNEEGDCEVIIPVLLAESIGMSAYKICKLKNYVATCKVIY